VKAAYEKETNAQCQRADKQRDENGRNNCEFDGRSSLIVKA
jgi:hypothetical protein